MILGKYKDRNFDEIQYFYNKPPKWNEGKETMVITE
jgi:hypothetical protein